MAYTEANGLQEVSKMMKRFTSFLFLALFLLIMLGCSDDDPTGEVNVEWDQQVDFTQFQTFGIVTSAQTGIDGLPNAPEEVIAFNDYVNQQIRLQFQNLGLTESANPDVWVGNLAWVGEQSSIVYECVPGNWWGYWGWYWDYCAWSYPTIVDYEVGSLLITVGQAAPEKPVFIGLARGIDPSVDTRDRVDTAVAEIFSQWPSEQTGN
jgi:hypothetical protein